MPLRRILTVAAVSIAAATGLGACSSGEATSHGETEGIYVTAGALKYQLQISRVLNPTDAEDRDYIKGILPADSTLPGDEDWFGIFLRAFNNTGDTHAAASEFSIVDTTGKEFEPVTLDPEVNVFAYEAGPLDTGQELPAYNSPGQQNATQGGLVLFKIPSASFANRPFEFRIKNPDGEGEATVELDI